MSGDVSGLPDVAGGRGPLRAARGPGCCHAL